MHFTYTDNGSKIAEWIPVTAGFGKTLKECLTEAKAKGLTWDEETLPPAPIDPIPLGHTVSGVTYGITPADQMAWTSALTALDNAAALGAFDANVTPVQAVLGPILDRDGTPAPSMTVMQFRGVMAQVAIRIGQIRAGAL